MVRANPIHGHAKPYAHHCEVAARAALSPRASLRFPFVSIAIVASDSQRQSHDPYVALWSRANAFA
jgi:hypothetical protein